MKGKESGKFRPSHYHSQPFVSSLVQETIFKQIQMGDNKSVEDSGVKAMWVSFAVKHLLRAGLKDDVDVELKKAEDYLHKARTGDWLEES